MTSLKIDDKTNELLSNFGLDWEVKKKPLYADNGDQDDPVISDDDMISTPFFATVRQDNKTALGTVSSRYEPKQNVEILQIMKDAAQEHDLEMVKGGAFKGGKSIFMQLEIPDVMRVEDDEVKKYLFAISSHDGSSSLKFGISNMVMSCSNQFNQFVKRSKFSFRHTQSIHEQSMLLSEKIGAILLKQENLYSVFNKFLDEDVDKKFVEATVDHLLDLEKYRETHDEFSTRKENQILALKESIDNEMSEKGDTLWGLFNGITYYANHEKTYPKRENGQFESIMTGGGHHFMNKGFDFIRKENDIEFNLN